MTAYEFFFSPVLFVLLGLMIGSFLNVVIYRLPLMMDRAWRSECAELLGKDVELPPAISLALPRSACPSCGHQIAWYENIPVLSYLFLRGKCSACNSRISPRYPLVEAFTGMVFGLVAWRVGPSPAVLMWSAFMSVLIALAGIDWDTTMLPDDLTLPLMWAGIVAAAAGWTIPLQTSIVGAIAGYMSLWTVYWGFKLLTGKEGMGHGDFKLLAALGACLGWQAITPILIGAGLVGAIVGIAMKAKSNLREGKYVPFGPFLAGSAMLAMLIGSVQLQKLLYG